MVKRYIPGIFMASAVFALVAAAPVYAKENTLPEGLYIGTLSLGGMTETEAEQALGQLVEEMSDCTVQMNIDGAEVSVSARELGFDWTNRDALDEAFSHVIEGNLIRQYMERKDLEKKPVHIDLQASVTPEGLTAYMETNGQDLITQPENATITRTDGSFVITPEKTGMVLDAQATADLINQAMAERTGDSVAVDAVVVEQEPEIRADMLVTIRDVLGTFSTDFSSSGEERAANVRNGTEKLNGVLLMPGETLSGYEYMQPFVTENGYFTAAAYENGEVVDSVGGGVCQIATTLYNAALRAELEITERRNHSMVVNYVEPSMDAAIAGTYKDIKITNNYSTPIYIEGGTEDRTLTFTIYGQETRPENRTVEFVSETIDTTDPGDPIRREDPELAPGTTRQVQSAHIGRRSRLWKVVTVDGAETERIMLSEDTYNPSKAIILVGPTTASAPTAAVSETTAAPEPEVVIVPQKPEETAETQAETAESTETSERAETSENEESSERAASSGTDTAENTEETEASGSAEESEEQKTSGTIQAGSTRKKKQETEAETQETTARRRSVIEAPADEDRKNAKPGIANPDASVEDSLSYEFEE